jgi:hypothetical protein
MKGPRIQPAATGRFLDPARRQSEATGHETMNPRRATPKRVGAAARHRSMTEEAKPLVEPVVVSNDELPNAARSAAPAIRIEGVTKRFGATQALAGIDLEIQEGAVFGLLGPNGAGKTTLVRILSTLLLPDAGRAEVLGHDVVQDPRAVREMIALTGQFAAVDEMLTGRENLEMFGRLFKLSPEDARQRADELLDRFDLAGARSPGTDLLRGDAAPARSSLEPLDESADPLPRRADDRARPPQPQRDLGDRARAPASRNDAAADDPVPRGGRRAGRTDRRDRPRQRDRRRDRQRAQGQRRGPDPGARAHGRRPARARRGRADQGRLRRAGAG